MAESVDRVGIVFVSHSKLIAEGLVDLAHQMAPDVKLIPAGGTDDGRIGTSFELVTAGVAAADSGTGVVLLCDLGSAILTAETALDFLDDEVRGRVRIVDAPIVEGGVAAAVAAQAGDGIDAVVAAARTAAGDDGTGDAGTDGIRVTPDEAMGSAGTGASTGFSRTVTLVNADGLHARPAAELVKLAATFAPRVTVNGVDAKSLLAIMALGVTKGSEVVIATEDPEGGPAVEAIAELAAAGFGEA